MYVSEMCCNSLNNSLNNWDVVDEMESFLTTFAHSATTSTYSTFLWAFFLNAFFHFIHLFSTSEIACSLIPLLFCAWSILHSGTSSFVDFEVLRVNPAGLFWCCLFATPVSSDCMQSIISTQVNYLHHNRKVCFNLMIPVSQGIFLKCRPTLIHRTHTM